MHDFIATPVSAATLTVGADGTGGYTSLSSALNAASAGDTIYIQKGDYSESPITISKNNITIIGEGADKVTLSMPDGPLLIQGSGCDIENLKFLSSQYLLQIQSPNCIVRNNIFVSHSISIESSYNLISNNIFLNPVYTKGGIVIAAASSYNAVRDNVILRATTTICATIYGSSNLFENNTIRDSTKYGLFIYSQGTNNTIAKNSFINNPTSGIALSKAGSNNKIYLNMFSGNGKTVTNSGTTSTISWVSPSTIDYTYNGAHLSGILGNYWGSNYSGTDANNNGIGDTSYTVLDSLGIRYCPAYGNLARRKYSQSRFRKTDCRVYSKLFCRPVTLYRPVHGMVFRARGSYFLFVGFR